MAPKDKTIVWEEAVKELGNDIGTITRSRNSRRTTLHIFPYRANQAKGHFTTMFYWGQLKAVWDILENSPIRHAHLDGDVLSKAAEQISKDIAQMMQ